MTLKFGGQSMSTKSYDPSAGSASAFDMALRTRKTWASARKVCMPAFTSMVWWRSPQNQAHTGHGTASHVFSALPGTRITAVQWAGRKYHGLSSAGWFGGGWAFKTGMYGDGFRSIDGEADCYTHNFGSCYSQSGPSTLAPGSRVLIAVA